MSGTQLCLFISDECFDAGFDVMERFRHARGYRIGPFEEFKIVRNENLKTWGSHLAL